MSDVIEEMLSLACEAFHHALTAAVLVLALPLLAIAFVVALLFDCFTPRRLNDVPEPNRDAS